MTEPLTVTKIAFQADSMQKRYHSRWCFLLVCLWLRYVSQSFVTATEQVPWWKKIQRSLFHRLKKTESERLWKKPVVVENFVSAEEATILLDRYRSLLRESLHFAPSGDAKRSKYRTSRTVRLPPLGDDLVVNIERRAAALANFSHSYVEDFQLACYGTDELYGLHRDDDYSGQANRAATVLVYLKQPEQGGATIFTNRKLELETDLKNRQPLRTEQAALELFRSYCGKPRSHHIIVPAITGNAAMWYNWINDTFAAESTHGACPVVVGEKCVIQQWISRNVVHPLRDERVLAIFPAGADWSFREKLQNDNRGIIASYGATCLLDASARRDKLAPLCGSFPELHDIIVNEGEGPFSNVCSIQIPLTKYGLKTTLEGQLQDLTVSFWARNIPTGAILLSLDGFLAVRLKDDGIIHLQSLSENKPSTDARTIKLPDTMNNEWLWISLTLQNGGRSSELFIYPNGDQSGKMLRSSRLEYDFADCKSSPNELYFFKHANPQSGMSKSMDERIAFVSNLEEKEEFEPENIAFVNVDKNLPAMDVSFIIIHNASLQEEEIRSLRYQTKRYDINS
jgi:hypothetical protein